MKKNDVYTKNNLRINKDGFSQKVKNIHLESKNTLLIKKIVYTSIGITHKSNF